MANAEHLALLMKGVREWNLYRENHPSFFPDFSEAALRGAHLDGADLAGANLAGADLAGANLHAAGLIAANLRGTDFRGAELVAVNLSRASVGGATISEAKVGWTTFGDLDLSAVEGLDTLKHLGPSIIGVDTILKSGERIPEEFLRGCGVDPLIQKMLVGDGHSKSDAFTLWVSKGHNPLQRCFISYATEDLAFVNRLQKVLNERKVDYWYAPEHGEWGGDLQLQIDREISSRDRILLICSEVSLTKDWVQYEIERGIEQEKKRKTQVIFPIMIDGAFLDWRSPHATRLRKVLAADFRKATKGQAFDQRLPRLLKALGYAS